MVKDLEAILVSLEGLGRRTVLSHLRPGVSQSGIETLFGSIGLSVPTNLAGLYAWRDGTAVEPGEPLDDLQFFPGFYFLSLDDAMASYRRFSGDARWSEGWFPVFANGGGDFYAVDLHHSDESDAPVIGFILDQPEHPIEYQGIASMIATIAACYEEGAFYVDARGYLEMDDERHAVVAKLHNPEVPLWN